MNSIILDEIVNTLFKKYGKNVLFREYDFTGITINNTIAMYRAQSAINFPYIYDIQVHIFDKIKQSNSFFDRFHKCLYCNGKHAEYKMRCCNKYLHLNCGMENKFSCCHLNRYLAKVDKNECCVCLDETENVTQCGHHLCLSCLEQMYSKSNRDKGLMAVACPLCRTTIVKETFFTDYHNVRVNNKEEVVCISYI